ncbi:hypothetical protein H7T43_15475 [Peribacillus simplex]|nr:hypothetical protein [Peribacillus simplex]
MVYEPKEDNEHFFHDVTRRQNKDLPPCFSKLMIKRFGFIQQEAQVSQKGLFTLDRYGRAFKNYAKKPFHQRISGKGSLFSLMWLIKSSQGTAILGMLDKC